MVGSGGKSQAGSTAGTGEPFKDPIAVGYIYILKAAPTWWDDKIHGAQHGARTR